MTRHNLTRKRESYESFSLAYLCLKFPASQSTSGELQGATCKKGTPQPDPDLSLTLVQIDAVLLSSFELRFLARKVAKVHCTAGEPPAQPEGCAQCLHAAAESSRLRAALPVFAAPALGRRIAWESAGGLPGELS